MGAAPTTASGTYQQSAYANAAGSLASMVGTVAQMYAARRAARFNADQAEREAQRALQIGSIAATQKVAETRQLVGSQRAALGASGMEIESGADLLTSTELLGDLDVAAVKRLAGEQAWGKQAEAAMERYAGQQEVLGLAGDLAGEGIAAASSLSESWRKIKESRTGIAQKPKSTIDTFRKRRASFPAETIRQDLKQRYPVLRHQWRVR